MLALQLVFWCASIALVIGLWTPVAAVWVAASCLYVFFGLGVLGNHEEWVSHHVWVLVSCAALLPFMSSGRSYSLDRWLALRAGDAPPERGWQGGMKLVALQLTAIYF